MTHLPHFFHCDEWKRRQENVSQDGQLKENKENAEQGSVQFVFAFKKKHIYRTSWFFFFFYLCHLWPIRLFSQDILAFFPWETSGWVNMEEPRVNKIPADAGLSERILSGLTSRGVSHFPSSQHPFKKTAKTPLLERISHSWWRKSSGTLPVSGPSWLCLSEDALSTVGNNSIVFEVRLTVLSPGLWLNPNLLLTSGWLLMNFLNFLNLFPHL